MDPPSSHDIMDKNVWAYAKHGRFLFRNSYIFAMSSTTRPTVRLS